MSAPIPPPEAKHQKFANYVLDGMPPQEAYRKAGFAAATMQSRAAAASRLLKNVKIKEYMAQVRAAAAAAASEAAVLNLAEKRKFLARIVRVPLAHIDPEDKNDPNADLVESYRRSDTETGSSVQFKKLSPLAAIEADNKLCGDGQPDAAAVVDLAKAIATLAGPVLPNDRM